MKYTLGFIFDKSLQNVLLIHKNRPEKHVGLINGLGGKFDGNENGFTCISREAKEESDIFVHKDDWTYAGVMGGEGWSVEVYCSIYNGSMTDAHTMEDQKVEWFSVNNLPENVIQNLRWLIPFTIELLSKEKDLPFFNVVYK